MTDYVIDTVSLVKYLEDDLPGGADSVFRAAEAGRNHLFLPEIALGEFAYIALRGRLRLAEPSAAVSAVVTQILDSGFIEPSSLTRNGWSLFLGIPVPELHDRMIAADALDRGCPLVTNDPSLQAVAGLRTIWR